MKKILITIAVALIAAASYAQQEYNALRPKDGVKPSTQPDFVRTYKVTALAAGFTNTAAPYQIQSIEIRRIPPLGSGATNAVATTNVFTMTRSRSVTYPDGTSTWTDILVLQGWTNAYTTVIEPAAFVIDVGDSLSITNTVTNLAVTINAGKR